MSSYRGVEVLDVSINNDPLIVTNNHSLMLTGISAMKQFYTNMKAISKV